METQTPHLKSELEYVLEGRFKEFVDKIQKQFEEVNSKKKWWQIKTRIHLSKAEISLLTLAFWSGASAYQDWRLK